MQVTIIKRSWLQFWLRFENHCTGTLIKVLIIELSCQMRKRQECA
uniref:Uncharacterized protein n=1 Tax=Anguilla anguilla TaxID=7936 RepID=A0A0E9PL73_ANGAN